MSRAAASRTAGLALALLVAAAGVAMRLATRAERHDRFHLPAFDGHVYVAMAERPEVFTVAPWGYRLLAPVLAGALPFAHPVRGYAWLTPIALVAGAGFLHLFLRRLGYAGWAALLGVAAFGFSSPVAELVRYQVLVDPVALALLVAFLWASTAGAGPGRLALLATLGVLAKEALVLLAPAAHLLLRRGRGERWGRCFAEATLVAAPGLAAILLLRLWWTPALAGPGIVDAGAALGRLPDRLAAAAALGPGALLVSGLVPLAALGACSRRARPFAPALALLAAAALVLPLLNPDEFHTRDVRRLPAYALPALVPLALAAVDRVLARWLGSHALLTDDGGGSPQPPAPRARAEVAAALVTLLLLAAPFLALDRYRRADLRGSDDAPLVLAACRLSLGWARQLERGEPAGLDLEARPFQAERPALQQLGRMRWFLAAGFAPGSARGDGAAPFATHRAELLVPVLTPRPLEAALRLNSPLPAVLRLTLNGQALAPVPLDAGATTVRVRLPAGPLYRGDNRLGLATDAAGLALAAYALRPVPPE